MEIDPGKCQCFVGNRQCKLNKKYPHDNPIYCYHHRDDGCKSPIMTQPEPIVLKRAPAPVLEPIVLKRTPAPVPEPIVLKRPPAPEPIVLKRAPVPEPIVLKRAPAPEPIVLKRALAPEPIVLKRAPAPEPIVLKRTLVPVPEPTVEKDPVYHGEHPCQAIKADGQSCTNRAYYLLNQMYVCGVHSLKDKAHREELPINPGKKEQSATQLKQELDEVERQAAINRQSGVHGQVIVYKMKMMKTVERKPGFLLVFPNAKHGSRKDGLGMPSLSPMMMGPINHNQPKLPPAKNLENLHQSNKVFPSEVDSHGNPKPEFYQTQLAMYQDPVPHRHKETSGHENVPVYSVWRTKDGQELHLSYIESRQIYCHYYEQFALKSPDFAKLKQLIHDGYNLQICGYDAYQPTRTMDEHYLDPSRPFGHELVLYTLLTQDPRQYPWRKHQTIDLGSFAPQ